MRPSQTFQKRQKELARQEKQRAKAQRKAQRKLEKQAPETDIETSDSSTVMNGSDGDALPDTEAEANSDESIA
ncbi:MAG: hypothetical protein LAN64_15975 [Acidobacteriia bacterium]|nr:hypothetical protein [Terriglobia bacterium]